MEALSKLALHFQRCQIMSHFSRFLFWALILASVGACSLWIMGGNRSEYSTSSTINANPETVFAFLVEPDRLKDWSEGLVQVGHLESNVDENGFSKRITTERVISENGQEIEFQDEVLRYDPHQSLSIQSSNRSIIITSIFALEPQGDQTLVSYRVKTLHCGLGRFMAPFQNDSRQNQIENELRRLKEAVESTSLENAEL